MMKTNPGNYFEDFQLGQEIIHAVPRTITTGDVALYIGLTGSRFAVPSADSLAQSIGLAQPVGALAADAAPGHGGQAPVDDLLLFHLVFGRTVADISLNAIANLGYANCKFGAPAYPGDTVSARSTVIGLKENSNGESGVVYVHSIGRNQRQEVVLDYIRWVMVRKRDKALPAAVTAVPTLPDKVAVADFHLPAGLDLTRYDPALIGAPHLWEDYALGERIDHVDGMTLEESDHMTATRLYQNNAKVHFNQHSEGQGRFGRRLIYGGHIISLARALSFNGLAPAFKILAINGGRHLNPSFAGDTIYAWSEVMERIELPGRADIGALRLKTRAAKDHSCHDFPGHDLKGGGAAPADLVLELDYTVLLKRRN